MVVLIYNILYSSDFPALVVKASGLASGKGVIIAADKEAACQAVVDVLDVSLIIKISRK